MRRETEGGRRERKGERERWREGENEGVRKREELWVRERERGVRECERERF